jgi:soluble lytic murein transglycosylase-like protein
VILIAQFWEALMRYASRVPARAKAIVMRSALSQVLSPGSFGRASDILLRLLLFMSVAAIAPPALASDVGDDRTAVQQQPSPEKSQTEGNQKAKEDQGPEPSAPSTAPKVCEALATAAATNDLPVDFFTRLIWQESQFKPDAISRKGAQGIAQFMPTTARLSGLENPFDPLEAIAKSGQLLRDLRREFGNLGLAAAAYNAGSGRVRDWLGSRRPLPQETRAYVRIVTGRSVEEWAAAQAKAVEMPSLEPVPCNLPPGALIQPRADAAAPRPETVKPWGVEVVGGPTPAKALARYREWRSKYAALVADREPHVVIRGILGEMGAARVRVGEETRAGAQKLCAALLAAGTYCDVLRN